MDTEPSLLPPSAAVARVPWLAALVQEGATALTLALLLVPMLVSTVAGFVAPPPWHVEGMAEAAPVLFAAVMAWVVLPLLAGLWLRRWWWGPLCLGVVLLAAMAWEGGHPVFSPRLGLKEAAPTEVRTIPVALAFGLLAAVVGTVGVVWGRRGGPGGARALRTATMLALVCAVMPVGVGLVFAIANPGALPPLLNNVTFLLLLGAATGGALSAGVWLCRWWWPLACLLGVGGMTVWAFDYAAALDRLSWDAVGLLYSGVELAVLSGFCAAVGVAIGRRRPSSGEDSAPEAGAHAEQPRQERETHRPLA